MTRPEDGAVAIAARVASGAASAEEVVGDALARIDAQNEALGAFLSVDREGALARAAELDAARARGAAPGPLAGVPVALKANMCLAGQETNCGSRILAGYRPPYTATFVERLIAAGAVPVGVTNMDEFAMGSSGENSAFGVTRNPWDLERVPGGSSSGAASAVAAGLVPIALGSDTGGSVRQPAAVCGVTGFKPTYGRVSRYGLIAFASSLDQVSPFARDAADVELAFAAISGHDPRDSTSLPEPAHAPGADDAGALHGLRVGVPRQYFPEGIHPGVEASVREALGELERLGAELVEIDLPHTEHAIATYYVVATAEASSNLARYDGVRYGLRAEDHDGSLQGMFARTRDAGFGPEVKRRILLGTYVLSSGYYDAWYGRALRVRRLLRAEFDAAFERVDVVAGATSPTPAFRLGERTDDPVAMYLSDALTTPASLAGLPAISVPSGFTEDGGRELPVGLQLVGAPLDDGRVLRTARAYQAATDHHLRRPTR